MLNIFSCAYFAMAMLSLSEVSVQITLSFFFKNLVVYLFVMELDGLFIHTGCTLFIRYAYYIFFPVWSSPLHFHYSVFLRAKNLNVDEALFENSLWFLFLMCYGRNFPLAQGHVDFFLYYLLELYFSSYI